MLVFICKMEIVKKYKPTHYTTYLPKIEKIIGKHTNIGTWVKSMGMSEILIWTQILEYLKTNNYQYFEPTSKLITLLIKFFMLELDVDEDNIKLTNTQLYSLIDRFEHIIKCEYAYRNDTKDKRIEYTLLKDV